jgi:DNA gyrase inhibitor GyrI
MNLTLEPEIVTFPEAHYVYLERVGPFMEIAPQAWQDLHKLEPAISVHNQITGAFSQYKMGPRIYRAGFMLSEPPAELPEGLSYAHLGGGKYSRFVLTGSYAQLPQASGQVWDIVADKQIALRDDFAIENYANDPKTTPEAELITEILVPTA